MLSLSFNDSVSSSLISMSAEFFFYSFINHKHIFFNKILQSPDIRYCFPGTIKMQFLNNTKKIVNGKNHETKNTKKTEKDNINNLKTSLQYSLIINKHNQKLTSILENQKIYGDFLNILTFWVSLSRTHLQSKTFLFSYSFNYFVNGFWKVKPKVSVI